MKKALFLMLSLVFVATGAFASEKVGADAMRAQHREEMKKIKQEMREKRAANPGPKAPSKMQEFWRKEGERSGLAGSGNGAGNFIKNLNPMPFFKSQDEQYKARKVSATQVK